MTQNTTIATNNEKISEREIYVAPMKVHIRSVFKDKTPLNDALRNIIIRRITDAKDK